MHATLYVRQSLPGHRQMDLSQKQSSFHGKLELYRLRPSYLADVHIMPKAHWLGWV